MLIREVYFQLSIINTLYSRVWQDMKSQTELCKRQLIQSECVECMTIENKIHQAVALLDICKERII